MPNEKLLQHVNTHVAVRDEISQQHVPAAQTSVKTTDLNMLTNNNTDVSCCNLAANK